MADNEHITLEEYIQDNILDEIILDISLELHWHATMYRLGLQSNSDSEISPASRNIRSKLEAQAISNRGHGELLPSDRLTGQSFEPNKAIKSSSASSGTNITSGSSIAGQGRYNMVQCPVCLEQVGGSRFAPHLEKCLKGKVRKKERGGNSALVNSKRFNFPSLPVKPRKIKEWVDPYPNSLVIRVKLKDGEPYGNVRREGVDIKEFEDSLKESQSSQIENSVNCVDQVTEPNILASPISSSHIGALSEQIFDNTNPMSSRRPVRRLTSKKRYLEIVT